MKKILTRAISLCVSVALSVTMLAGCGGDSGTTSDATASVTSDDSSTAADTEAGTSDMVVTLGMGSAWADLIPYNGASGGYYSQLVLGLLYDRLIYLSMDGTISPRNADSWEISEDRLSIVFHLNEDAVWSDGEAVTASDYVFAAKFITDPSCTATHRSMYNILEGVNTSGYRTGTADEVGAEAVDVYTLKYSFNGPISEDVTFSSYLYLYQPLPEHLLADVAPEEYLTIDLWNNPVGSGPLVFESTIAGSELIMTSNQNFYLGAPEFSKFKITVMSNSNMASALIAGDIDIAYPPLGVDDINALEGIENLNMVHLEAATQPYTIMINNLVYPDSRVHQALSMAIDRETICALLQNASPMESPILSTTKYYDSSITYTYDPEGAKALFEEAAADGAFDLEEGLVIHTPSGIREKVANILQQNYEAAGVKTTIQVEEAATMFAGFYDGTTGLGMVNFTLQTNPFYLKNQLTNKSATYINWPDSTWDDYYDRFMNAGTDEERIAITSAMQADWVEKEPIIMYAGTYEDYAFNKKLGDEIQFEDVGLGNLPVWKWNIVE